MTQTQIYLIRSLTFVIFLLPADLLFCIHLDRKPLFLLRLPIFAAMMVFGMIAAFNLTGNTVADNVVPFFFAFMCSIAMIWLCFDISLPDSVFCAVAGYSAQFLESLVEEFVERVIGRIGFRDQVYSCLIMLLIYTAVYLLFGRRIKKGQNLDLKRLYQLFLLSGALFIEILFCGLIRPYWQVSSDRGFIAYTMLPLFMFTAALLALQFSLLSRKSLAEELLVVNELLKKQEAQYQISRETIDSINRKCHDMRHQIRAIGGKEHIDPDAIREMTASINIYDSLYKTGSPALDTILAENALYCQENHISINCMADGKKLSFMRDADIYSLFGNLLENAIHAVSELPEDDRDIFLSVVCKDQLLSIHSHNTYAGIIAMKDGLPLTTNHDTMNHGIGTKSIQFIVERYNGTVSFEAKDGVFYVDILFAIE